MAGFHRDPRVDDPLAGYQAIPSLGGHLLEGTWAVGFPLTRQGVLLQKTLALCGDGVEHG